MSSPSPSFSQTISQSTSQSSSSQTAKSSSDFVLPSKNCSILVNNQPTQFIITKYSNCLSIIITQTNKISIIYKVQPSSTLTTSSSSSSPCDISILLGNRNDLHSQVLARRLYEIIVSTPTIKMNHWSKGVEFIMVSLSLVPDSSPSNQFKVLISNFKKLFE